MREALSDEQVEQEIQRLLSSPYVKIAKEEQRIRYRRRQYLYKLRGLEKRGKELTAQGFNPDALNAEIEAFEKEQGALEV